jgi:hypothetical protein
MVTELAIIQRFSNIAKRITAALTLHSPTASKNEIGCFATNSTKPNEKTSRSVTGSPCRILRGTDKRWIVSVAMIPEGMDIEGLHPRAPAPRPSCRGLLPAFLGRSADR